MKRTAIQIGTAALLCAGQPLVAATATTSQPSPASSQHKEKTAAGDLRVDYSAAAPGVQKAMLGLEEQVRNSGIEHDLLVLVKMRASHLNQCLYCLDMHEKEALKLSKDRQKIDAIEDWQKATVFTPRERAALAWTDALTLIATTTISDELYNEVESQFDPAEMANLSLAIIAINGWNRLNIGLRNEPERCPIDF